MMKKIILLLLFTIPLLIQAQDTGIQFQHEASWKEILAKAKAENKYIFMDCFTTWCGPCKYMSASIFPLKEVGDFINDKFISVAVQLDTTDKDNDAVKSWYQGGHDIAEKYKIRAYPTYLVFDADGKPVHRFVGSSPAEEFLAKIKISLNPETQYFSLLDEYRNGKKDSAFLLIAAKAAYDAYDIETAKTITDEYLSTQTNLYTKLNLILLTQFTKTSLDRGFDIMLNHADRVDSILGAGSAASVIDPIIMREEVYTRFPKEPNAKPDWVKITNEVSKKYPVQAAEIVAKTKVALYQRSGDWNNYRIAIVDYMNKFGQKLTPDELNNYAWTVFQNCPDMKCVAEALEWSKRSFEGNNTPGFMDTYANILYKLGRKDEAIEWEKKAMGFAQGDDKKGYQEVIDKMKNNEKTWN